MEQIAPSTSPRRSMARKLATLPPIATGLPERPLMSMNEKHLEVDARSPSSSTSGSSCHNMLPCIMITPSSPTHEYDYEVHYFELPEPQPSRCRGFFSSIRKAFCSSSCTSRNDAIALPESPSVSKYGYTASSTDRSWSASRRFRMILALAAVLFFSLHLVALPKMDHGMYGVFSTDHLHHGGAESHAAMAASSSSWETVSEWQPAPPSAHEPARDVKPIDVVELAHPASSLD